VPLPVVPLPVVPVPVVRDEGAEAAEALVLVDELLEPPHAASPRASNAANRAASPIAAGLRLLLWM